MIYVSIYMEVPMPEWALECLRKNKLSDLDAMKIASKVRLNEVAFRKETKDLSATNEDKLRRYDM